ncbi:MAG TPA: hypothetical protein DCR55_09840 [Lentisphaeria bacterium]|nr:hypothetical protein [Lentisphaeria bacterium]
MAAAGAGLLAVAVRTPQLALPLVLGALAAALYVLPACGVRIKDLPAVKTLYPPLILAAAILGPNSWLVGSFPSPYLIAWCYLFLLMNVWLFDLRDIEGDRTAGVRTLAVLVGPAWSRGLLFGVAFVAMLMGFTLGTHYHSAAPIAASVVALGYTKERTWLYYELVVDGILLLPLLMLE